MSVQYSDRVENLVSSPIREILSVIDRPGMISFAGGLPSSESFPRLNIKEIPRSWLQYGPSEGDWGLREWIARDANSKGLVCTPEQVLVLSGSQQGIDMAAKLFTDPGSSVAVESPTYLAALQVFRFYGAQFCTFDRSVNTCWSDTAAAKPRIIYTVPTFQNPTGHCYTDAERSRLAAFCDVNDVPLFEDDPYRDLVYDPCSRTPVCAQLKKASWMYQSSFSKSLAPGLRLGYMIASPNLIPYLTRLKQAADLHSSRISQWIVLQLLEDPHRGDRLQSLAQSYAARRDHFQLLLEQHLGDWADWQKPPGGLFFWLRLQRHCDTRQLLTKAIDRGLAFMPGEPFFAGAAECCVRLNFSHADEQQAERGIRILRELLGGAIR